MKPKGQAELEGAKLTCDLEKNKEMGAVGILGGKSVVIHSQMKAALLMF